MMMDSIILLLLDQTMESVWPCMLQVNQSLLLVITMTTGEFVVLIMIR